MGGIELNQQNQRLKLILFYWLPVVIYALFIFYFSGLSDPYVKLPLTVRTVFSLSSMVDHIIEYCIFYLLFFRALYKSGAKNVMLVSLIGISVYGVIDEAHQLFVPGRFFSLSDMGCDVLGGILGFALIVISCYPEYTKLLNKKKQKHT